MSPTDLKLKLGKTYDHYSKKKQVHPGVTLFGILYADELEANWTQLRQSKTAFLRAIIRGSGISEASYVPEISSGVGLAEYVEVKPEVKAFWRSSNSNANT